MKEKRDKIESNMSNVFKFSIMQIIKNKVFIILTLLCAILMFVLTPIMIYMTGEFGKKDTSTIDKVYMIDENGLLDKTKALTKDGEKLKEFGKIKWYKIETKFDKYKKKFLKNKDNKTSLLVQATVDKNSYLLNIYKCDDCDIKDSDINTFSEKLVEFYNQNKIKNVRLDEYGQKVINTSINTTVEMYGEENNDRQSSIVIISIIMMVVMFFLVLSGENISTQIVTEKSTKLVEYLLVNVKPLHLVCGKILASVVVSLIQMLTMIGSGLLSILICKSCGLISSFDETLSIFKINSIVGDISLIEILGIIIFLVAGFVFYVVIACMLASTVSRLEDLSNATMIYGMIIIIAVYAVIIIQNVTEPGRVVDNILVMLPFTSVFVTPSYILLGKLDMINYIIAAIIQIVCVILTGMLAAKVYLSLIMYSGKKLTLRQIITIFKGDKEGEIYE